MDKQYVIKYVLQQETPGGTFYDIYQLESQTETITIIQQGV